MTDNEGTTTDSPDAQRDPEGWEKSDLVDAQGRVKVDRKTGPVRSSTGMRGPFVRFCSGLAATGIMLGALGAAAFSPRFNDNLVTQPPLPAEQAHAWCAALFHTHSRFHDRETRIEKEAARLASGGTPFWFVGAAPVSTNPFFYPVYGVAKAGGCDIHFKPQHKGTGDEPARAQAADCARSEAMLRGLSDIAVKHAQAPVETQNPVLLQVASHEMRTLRYLRAINGGCAPLAALPGENAVSAAIGDPEVPLSGLPGPLPGGAMPRDVCVALKQTEATILNEWSRPVDRAMGQVEGLDDKNRDYILAMTGYGHRAVRKMAETTGCKWAVPQKYEVDDPTEREARFCRFSGAAVDAAAVALDAYDERFAVTDAPDLLRFVLQSEGRFSTLMRRSVGNCGPG